MCTHANTRVQALTRVLHIRNPCTQTCTRNTHKCVLQCIQQYMHTHMHTVTCIYTQEETHRDTGINSHNYRQTYTLTCIYLHVYPTYTHRHKRVMLGDVHTYLFMQTHACKRICHTHLWSKCPMIPYCSPHTLAFVLHTFDCLCIGFRYY